LPSDFVDLGSSPSYATQGVAQSPAGGKVALQVMSIKDGDPLLILLTVQTKGVMRQQHAKAGEEQRGDEFYRNPLHWCPF